MPKKKVTDGSEEVVPTNEGPHTDTPVPTHKEVLQALHAEMTKYGIISIGQLEVKISQLQ